MPARSAERTEFLSDVIIGAIEGGIGYWSQCIQYQYADDEIHVVVGKVVLEDPNTRATVRELDEDVDGGVSQDALHITLDTVASGLGKIRNPLFSISANLRQCIVAADLQNDAGMIDAEAADVIVQAGLFGKIIYG